MGREEFQWHTISYRDSKDLILVHMVQLKPMIKAHSSGKMVSSGIDDSDHFGTLCLKKLMMMNISIIIIIPQCACVRGLQ